MSSFPASGIYIYISYPRTPDISFNTDYYMNTHLPLTYKHWSPYGLKSWSVVQFPEGDASGLHTQAILLFESEEAFQEAWDAQIPELMHDLKNYSNVVPTQWRGKVLGSG